MGFPSLPKLLILNDPERRNGPYFSLFFTQFWYHSGPISSKWLKITLYCLQKCKKNVEQKSLVYSDII